MQILGLPVVRIRMKVGNDNAKRFEKKQGVITNASVKLRTITARRRLIKTLSRNRKLIEVPAFLSC